MWTVATHLLNSRFLGNFSRVTTGDSLSAQWQVLQKFRGVKRSDSFLLPNGRFAEDSYDWSVMSSIVGPSLDSILPKTILPMEVVMVSRYMDPVELSRTTLLALMLETLGIIPSTAATSVEAPQSSWCRVIGCTTANALVGGNVGTAGIAGGQVGCWVGAGWRNRWALPHSFNIPDCHGISMAVSGVFRPLVGGSSTQLNRVMEGSWQLSLGLTILRPSRMSRLVMITNSPMARHSSLTLSAKGWASGLAGR